MTSGGTQRYRVQAKNAVQGLHIPAGGLGAAFRRRTLASRIRHSLDLSNVASEACTLVDKQFQ